MENQPTNPATAPTSPEQAPAQPVPQPATPTGVASVPTPPAVSSPESTPAPENPPILDNAPATPVGTIANEPAVPQAAAATNPADASQPSSIEVTPPMNPVEATQPAGAETSQLGAEATPTDTPLDVPVIASVEGIQEAVNMRYAAEHPEIMKSTMTEEEAKALMLDETRRVNKDLKSHNGKAKRTLALVGIVGIIICVMVVGFMFLMSTMEQAGGQSGGLFGLFGGGNKKPSSGNSGQTTEVSLDGELVKATYGQFDNIMGGVPRADWFYLHDGELTPLQKYKLALENVENTPCTTEHRFTKFNDGTGAGHEVVIPVGYPECKSGEQIREKYASVFGEEIDLAQFAGEAVYSRLLMGGVFYYYVDSDEVANVADGSWGWDSGSPTELWIDRKPYRAEQEGDNLYIYEVAVIPCVAAKDEPGCSFGGTMNSFAANDEIQNNYEQRYYHLSPAMDMAHGERIPELDRVPYTDFDILTWADKEDQFRWTFTRNSAGDYIYQGVKKISS